MFPLAILLLGGALLAGFMAFRPWPAPGSSGQPIKPGTYVVEIITGKPPAASNPPDRTAEVQAIESGILTVLGLWAAAKLASVVSGLGWPQAGGAPSGEDSVGDQESSDIDSAISDLGEVA